MDLDILLKESWQLLATGDLKGSYDKLTTIIDLNNSSHKATVNYTTDKRHDVCLSPEGMGSTNEAASGDSTVSREVLSDVYNSRGHIRYLWVDFSEAVEDYSRAIELNDTNSIAYYNRGQIHYRMGRYTEAENDLLKALDINPDFDDAQMNLCQVQKDIAAGRTFNHTKNLL